MYKRFDKRIMIQVRKEENEEYVNFLSTSIRARITKSKSDHEFQNAGAVQDKMIKDFEVRYFSKLEEIEANTQMFRIVYKGQYYNIIDYDDYMEKHLTVKLKTESY